MVWQILAGLGAGLGIGLLGKPFEVRQEEITKVTYAPKKQLSIQETYSPTYTYSPQIIISSPYATQKASVSKKEMPQLIPQVIEMPQETREESKMNFDLTSLTLLGIVAIALFMLLR